ncbi:hypothetical protein FSP39_001548 [Pinctada imbricata]|uniref:Centrosomal protein of 120 kDa n=1 Tax=Pinctada imbricata TaxID=66713 RepID=A0AA88Y8F6_PINIB|nr:hypothetical protein FSP39_001548 [Pinctada imbricata]
MVEKEKFLVVIAILEGRRFPKRVKHKIIAEARFDGELLATDPVEHVETPNFTQELAWELDRRGLQQHRLQRTSIKIQCYACDSVSTVKEAIGYIILDLRSVSNKQTPKWYPLLHSKYSKNKSEIKLSIYLDEDGGKGETTDSNFRAKEAPARLVDTIPSPKIDAHHLKPVLNEAEGYYQIGSMSQCKEYFVLSVTISHAVNLAQLIPSTAHLPETSDYFFYFSLLGNDITNEPFKDLMNPNFPAERASVRIKSNVNTLLLFFSHQPGIQVHLCCGDQSLGSCEIPLNSLLQKNSTEIFMRPVVIEGIFQLIPPNKSRALLPSIPDDLAAAVGVSIVLRREETTTGNQEKVPEMKDSTPQKKHPPRSPEMKRPIDNKTTIKEINITNEDIESPTHIKKAARDTDMLDDTHNDYNTEENISSLEEDKHREKTAKVQGTVKAKTERDKPPPARSSHHNQTGVVVSESQSTTNTHLAIPIQAHHFTFSIDLRSIKDIQSTATLFVYLRYSYPFFGSAAPILTNPPVEIRKGMEVLLPQSFCAFDFACSLQQLQETFLNMPLIVEVFHKDKQLSNNVLLGTAKLPLEQVMNAEKFRNVSNKGSPGWRQTLSESVTVYSSENKSRAGTISFVLGLDDWGPISSQQIVMQQESSSNTQGLAEPFTSSKGKPSMSPKHTEAPRETAEYQAAVELEMWKESQERQFETQLKQKEMAYMKALTEEWKKRDKEREILMKKKMSEYAGMEEKLHKTLADLEKREKQLAFNEQETARMRQQLHREHETKLQEMKEASHRLKEDCNHQVELERLKIKELEILMERHKNEVREMEKKYHNLEKEFEVYKEQQNSKPEVRLQSEINLLTLEKVELERKLDAVTKSKVHYKQQWGRALKELAKAKQKEQTFAKAELKRQQQELEHMRLRYLAAEERDVVQSEKKELEDLKNELSRLKKVEEERSKLSPRSPREGYQSVTPDMNTSLDDHITRLIEERDTLLRTGVYSTHDKIIAELDRQIRESLAQKKSNLL